MLRLPSFLQAVLLVIVAVVSCVHGLGLQDPSATSKLVQGVHDTENAVSTGELSGVGRDLQTFTHKKFFVKKKFFVPKPKKKIIIIKPKKKIFIPKPKKKIIIVKKKPIFFHKKFFHKKKFYKHY